MKKITIDLKAVQRVNAVPLQQALDLYRKTVAEIATHKARFEDLKKEVSDFLAVTDPSDETRLAVIAGKKLQLDMFPGFITRREEQIGRDLIPTLAKHVDEFKSSLRRFYSEVHEAAAVQIADLFRPYFSTVAGANGEKTDRARTVALQTDTCFEIHQRIAAAENIRWDHQPRSNRPAYYDAELVGAAEALLSLAEKN